jgi:hypothetical protein
VKGESLASRLPTKKMSDISLLSETNDNKLLLGKTKQEQNQPCAKIK